ncbi:VanZ family protein [Streptomyces sp. NPDC101181]|uniref:VanZ family protein n=1 Tax=Streptomyces sp. NPDC101181 TaxID=3366125 RepID=UPI0038282B4D
MAVLSAVLLGLVAFSVFLAKVTLTPSPASEDLVTSNLQPGRSLRQYAEDYTFLAACKQAGGNVLLGVPFGILLPFFVPRRMRMIRMTLLTAAAMAIVELIQGALVTGRAFDIDDVILNTTGALLGYLVLGRRLSHRYYVYTDDSAPAAADRDREPTPERARMEKTEKPQRARKPQGERKTPFARQTGPKGEGESRRTPRPAARPKSRPTSESGPEDRSPRGGGSLLARLRGR